MRYHTAVPLETLGTKRLDLLALSRSELEQLLQRRVEALQKRIEGLELAPTLLSLEAERAIRTKLKKMSSANLKDEVWFTYWLLVLRQEGQGIGLAGFKGPPNEYGEVEIGYGLVLEYEGRGYMTEAVHALVAWAFSQAECAVIAPSTAKANVASQRVLEKVGMKVYKETLNERFWRLEKPA